jgi:hypothetical protein
MVGNTYLEEAQGLAKAVAILCDARVDTTLYSIGILAGHSLELALKAYLLHVGRTERDLKDIGHDLTKAWECCKRSGLDLDQLPYWVQVLDYSHDHPYYFRYPRNNHKVAIPGTDELPKDLASILDMISSAMKT